MNEPNELGTVSSEMYDAGYKRGVADAWAGQAYDLDKERPYSKQCAITLFGMRVVFTTAIKENEWALVQQQK